MSPTFRHSICQRDTSKLRHYEQNYTDKGKKVFIKLKFLKDL